MSTNLMQILSNAKISIAIFLNICLFKELFSINLIESLVHNLTKTNYFLHFIWFGIIFHSVSYISSSFVEEEHQIWYYLLYTVFIIFYLIEIRQMIQTNTFTYQYNCMWMIFFMGHLVARRLNQTGDRWLAEWDFGDWLTLETNIVYNSLFVGLSMVLLIIAVLEFGSILTNVLTLTACILTFYFRALEGSITFIGIKKTESVEICLILFCINIAEIMAINLVPITFKILTSKLNRFDIKLILGTLIVILTLLSALTHKPHNIFIISMLIFSTQIVNRCTKLLVNNEYEIYVKCILYYWIGKQFFFYQGNSNSLASIDLAAGYIGLKSFNFIFVGIFLTIDTFSGPILSAFLLVYNLYEYNNASKKEKMPNVPKQKSFIVGKAIIFIMMFLPFISYAFCALVFRNHIFVWSVFSPKLLYEFYHLCLMSSIWLGFSVVEIE